MLCSPDVPLRKDSWPNCKDCAVSWQPPAVNPFKSPSAFEPRSYSSGGGLNRWLSKSVEQKTGHFHSTQDSSPGQSLLWNFPRGWWSHWEICIVVCWPFCPALLPLFSLHRCYFSVNFCTLSFISLRSSQCTQLVCLYINIYINIYTYIYMYVIYTYT